MTGHSIKIVGVVGTGVIGSSWTALFLAKGFRVLVSDPAPGAQETLSSYLESVWPSLRTLGLHPGASISNYSFVGPSLKDNYHELDFVQENAPEKVALKSDIIAEIDAATRQDVVIASSSSGLPSSQFVQKCKRNPGRVLIGHPFNPPHLMPLVEVVPHPGSCEDTVSKALEVYSVLGKRPIVIRREIPGFAANRLQVAVLQEAFSLVQRGIMSAEDVDTCMTTSLGPRWAFTGPFFAKVFAGGGSSNAFRHSMDHLGPAEQGWIKDMRKNEFELTDGNVDILEKSVQQMLKVKDAKQAERRRDEMMLMLLLKEQEGAEDYELHHCMSS